MTQKGFIRSSLLLINSRKEILFGVTWTTALATIIAGNGFPPIINSFTSILAMAMLSLSVYIYNDIVDRQMDAYSIQGKKKGRPIAHGQVTINHAQKFVTLTAVLGMMMCAYLGRSVLLIGGSFFILFYLYSYPKIRFKTMYVIKNIVTSLILPVAFLIGGTSIYGTITRDMMFLSSSYYLFLFLILPAGADWLDYEEDKAFNVKTIGNSFSWKQNILLFNLGIMIIIISAAINYFYWGSSYLSLIMIAGIGAPVIIYSNILSREDGITASYKLRPVAYVYLLLTPLFFALGVFF